MSLRLAMLMDPLGSIQPAKDSSFAMLLAAQARGWQCFVLGPRDLWLEGDRALGRLTPVQVRDDPRHWYEAGPAETVPLDPQHVDLLLMRKDPPVDMQYLALTWMLDHVKAAGVPVVNDPHGLREVSEKLYITWFPDLIPPTLVDRDPDRIRAFIARHGRVILKPLFAMGGSSVFAIAQGDSNTNVILETLTRHGTEAVMVQRFLPEIREGDKRILLIDGEPVPYALARIPSGGDHRGNLAVGGRCESVPLSARDREICARVAPRLEALGQRFVGLDVIGRHLTEINVTSPTCIRELDRLEGLDIAGTLLDALERSRP
ncbi:MAG: glutathione synthase [Gammaproteobacteria bacterium]|nr:MAG: glutathione synthase [Gammaproteobacteria bacterium]